MSAESEKRERGEESEAVAIIVLVVLVVVIVVELQFPGCWKSRSGTEVPTEGRPGELRAAH